MTTPTALPTVPVAERYSRAGYLGGLNREWMRDFAARTDSLGAWSQEFPCLEGCATLQGVLDEIVSSPAARRDELLHALLTLASRGDQVAGRAVMQTMLATVQWLARTAAGRGLEDAVSASLEAMWATISSYPLHRRQRVAANLKLDALKALAAGRSRELPASDLLETAGADHLGRQLDDGGCTDPADLATQPLDGTPTDDARAVLAWALSRDVITAEEAQLLALTHLGAAPVTLAEAAALLGTTPAAIRQRHSRAVRRLAAAVREAMQG